MTLLLDAFCALDNLQERPKNQIKRKHRLMGTQLATIRPTVIIIKIFNKYGIRHTILEQAGAELCQAQISLS